MLAGRQRGRRGTQRRFPTSRSGDRSRRLVSEIRQSMNKTLVVDIGGTHVKLLLEGSEQRMFDSGSKMQPNDFIAQLKEHTRDWKFDNISIGFPSPVRGGKILKEPKHLSPGWVGFDFGKTAGKTVQVINDDAMAGLRRYHR